LTYGYGHVKFGSSKDKALARKILLADDSVTAQNMGRKILTDAGYEVVTVNNGSAALKKVTEAQPDVIVLDVYMPGYSGLEVCQRIKDSRDTAHIPVLLTVGKLEPFKQDEARRARADAFIIKPFEASELTAALAKLEGRISVAPATRKEGRASTPSTMDRFERTAAASGPQYGDEESGWKSRIKFPRQEKEAQPDPEPEPYTTASGGAFRELITERPTSVSASPPMMDRPLPAGIPQDITPDEIAAIAAAAARVKGGISVEKNFERLTDDGRPAKAAEPNELAAVAEEPKPAKTEAVASVDGTEAPATLSVHAAVETNPVAEPLRESQTQETVPSVAISEGTAEIEQPGATLSAAAGTQTTEAAASRPAQSAAASEDFEPVTVAVGPAPAATIAPTAPSVIASRWVAEEIPVEAAESVLILEREMQKAYAAFAAAEHGQSYKSAPIDRDDEPMFATMAPPAIGTPLPMMDASGIEELRTPKDEEKPVESAGASAHQVEQHPNVSRPPAPAFAPAGPSSEDEGHAVVAFGGPELLGSTESTKAAALEASPTQASASPESTDVPTQSEVAQAASSLTSGSQVELAAATAAAWANWRDVRDSVLGAKNPVPAGETGKTQADSEESKKSMVVKKEEPTSAPQPEAAMAAAASVDSSAPSEPNLSNIVDNMLAELKPKLMAELAEKLKQEKSKK
jgi:twitching motility two-component system response regulator PilH